MCLCGQKTIDKGELVGGGAGGGMEGKQTARRRALSRRGRMWEEELTSVVIVFVCWGMGVVGV